MKLIHSKPIFVQLVVFSLLISLIPILIIGTFLFRKLETMVVDEMVNYHAQITSQYTKNIEEKLEQYQKSLRFISDNTMILNTLADRSQNPYARGETISEEVTKSLLLEKNSEIRNCMVYSMVKENPVYGNRASMIEEAGREVWYPKEEALEEGWFSYFVLGNEEPLLSIVKKVESLDTDNLTRTQLGIVKLDVYMTKLFAPAPLNDESEATYDVIVYSEDSEILYSTAGDTESVLRAYLKQHGKKNPKSGSLQAVNTYVVEQKDLDNYGMKLLFLFDNKEVLGRRAEIQWMVLPLVGALILIIIGCSYIYSRGFSSRIALLLQKFRTAETGNLTIQAPIEGKDEVAELDRQFTHMLLKLDELIKKNYIQQLENKETQLRNLQLQINPHFLYNTLETISSIAAVKQVFVVCDMCQKLGEIFRYSLGKDYGERVTLEQELTHIKNYVFIQKIRYGNRFEVFYNIEVDDQKYYLPRFILQPIVENAIVHGLGELTSTGTLELIAYEKEGMLCICIEDDGMGMDNQRVEKLRAYINSAKADKKKNKSIGIRNVNQRIKLSCGEQYGIFIESKPYQGSRFTLRLPVIKGGEADET